MPAPVPTLTVEDGSIVTGANSFTDLATIRQYAVNRGVSLTADDTALIPLAILATDYLQSFAAQFVGQPVSVSQPLAWPRQNVQQEDMSIMPTNEIPQALINAECQLVIEQANGITLMQSRDPNSPQPGGFVTEERIGRIGMERKYSERYGVTNEPQMPAVDALLAPLLQNSTPWAIRSLRV